MPLIWAIPLSSSGMLSAARRMLGTTRCSRSITGATASRSRPRMHRIFCAFGNKTSTYELPERHRLPQAVAPGVLCSHSVREGPAAGRLTAVRPVTKCAPISRPSFFSEADDAIRQSEAPATSPRGSGRGAGRSSLRGEARYANSLPVPLRLMPAKALALLRSGMRKAGMSSVFLGAPPPIIVPSLHTTRPFP